VNLSPRADQPLEMISSLVLPLNIEGNKHTFCRVLSVIRSGARAHASSRAQSREVPPAGGIDAKAFLVLRHERHLRRLQAT
jgi:hypothetical protein